MIRNLRINVINENDMELEYKRSLLNIESETSNPKCNQNDCNEITDEEYEEDGNQVDVNEEDEDDEKEHGEEEEEDAFFDEF